MNTNANALDLPAAAEARKQGQSWEAIAKGLSIPESTLRGRLRMAGLLPPCKPRGANKAPKQPKQPKQPTQKQQQAVAAAAAVPSIAAPPSAGAFVEPSWYPTLRYALRSEKGATLFGPRGCGKSTAIRQLATELARPTVTLQCAANMQIDSLLGSWTSEQGTLRFIDGPLTIAVRTGAWLLAEEANVIHPGVWSCVNTLTDKTGEGLRLPTGELVPANPDFRLVLIYNEGYAGTREVNAALKDRLMPIYCDYFSEGEEIRLLVGQTAATESECHRVVDVARMIRTANLRFDLSPRSLVRWIGLVKEGGFTWAQAYVVAILDLVGPPQLAAPQRAVLEEIGRNSVAQW